MVRKLLLLSLLPIAAGATFAGLFFFHYRGNYVPSPSVDIPFEQIVAPELTAAPATDSGTTRIQGGLVVIDAFHENFFAESEIVTLSAWVANRGYDVDIVDGTDLGEHPGTLSLLEDKLKQADSFLVMLPQEAYTEAEVDAVERFVDRGGKLLLVSDPTRPNRINDLAKRFGLEFRSDYLFNTVEYDRNFRHIFVRDFQPDILTNGLEGIALYIAGSIRSSGPGIAVTDVNTRSSLIEADQDFYPIARGDRRNVLAIGDFTFMVPPYNSFLDNDRLLSNLADYLTDSQKSFSLADFPHFFRDGGEEGIDILVNRDAVWDSGLQMRNGLSGFGVSSQMRAVENVGRDAVFLGLYDDAVEVNRYLLNRGIGIDEDVVSFPNALEMERDETAITLLHREEDRHVLVILGDSTEALSNAVEVLLDGGFRRDLINDYTGVRR